MSKRLSPQFVEAFLNLQKIQVLLGWQHYSTRSWAMHKAADKFREQMAGLADRYLELFLGLQSQAAKKGGAGAGAGPKGGLPASKEVTYDMILRILNGLPLYNESMINLVTEMKENFYQFMFLSQLQ